MKRLYLLIICCQMVVPGWAAGAGGGNSRGEVRESAEIISVRPHDPRAFTQGLFMHNGLLYESTGLVGHSSMRLVEPQSGRILVENPLPKVYFAEGAALAPNGVIQLTWHGGVGFLYDAKTLEDKGTIAYEGEAWGLAYDGSYLFMSNGTETIRVLKPNTFDEVRRFYVTSAAGRVGSLNELEVVGDLLLANVWGTRLIVGIDPASGRVRGWLDLSTLPDTRFDVDRRSVANGIAFDPERSTLLVTGKFWPHVYEVALPSWLSPALTGADKQP